MLLFLNFDGVLHPNAVQFDKTNKPNLDARRHHLFESSNALEAVIADFTNIRVVLNTWWAYVIGFDESLRYLPKSLSSRVDGSILQHASLYTTLPHRITLATGAADNSAEPVLILDHADARYPKHILHATFLLDPQAGLADPRAAKALSRVVSRASEKEVRLAESEKVCDKKRVKPHIFIEYHRLHNNSPHRRY